VIEWRRRVGSASWRMSHAFDDGVGMCWRSRRVKSDATYREGEPLPGFEPAEMGDGGRPIGGICESCEEAIERKAKPCGKVASRR
jgi:hypothetical protein